MQEKAVTPEASHDDAAKPSPSKESPSKEDNNVGDPRAEQAAVPAPSADKDEQGIQLKLIREGCDPRPLRCLPSKTVGQLKEQLDLPADSVLVTGSDKALPDAATLSEAGLKDGDSVFLRNPTAAPPVPAQPLAAAVAEPEARPADAPASTGAPPQLQLSLIREGEPPLPFECDPSKTFAELKAQLGLDPADVITADDGSALDDAATLRAQGLRDGDQVRLKAPTATAKEPADAQEPAVSETHAHAAEAAEAAPAGDAPPADAPLRLTLIRPEEEPLFFSCMPSDTLTQVKQQLQLPQSCLVASEDRTPLVDDLTVWGAGLRDGDKLYTLDGGTASASVSEAPAANEQAPPA
eukprot:4484543-Pleurochrysis_carterae.AAC.1